MTDMLAEVMIDLRQELSALPVDPHQLHDITARVEHRQRQVYGGDEQYICKAPSRDSQRCRMAERVAAGNSVQTVASESGVNVRTVYRAVKSYPEIFGRR